MQRRRHSQNNQAEQVYTAHYRISCRWQELTPRAVHALGLLTFSSPSTPSPWCPRPRGAALLWRRNADQALVSLVRTLSENQILKTVGYFLRTATTKKRCVVDRFCEKQRKNTGWGDKSPEAPQPQQPSHGTVRAEDTPPPPAPPA